MIADSIACVLEEAAPKHPVTRRQRTHQRVFEAALAFIERNLSNSELDAEDVAHHCGVTARYLRYVFQSHNRKVTAVIRDLRLERCKDTLQMDGLAMRSIIEIATDWGFTDPSYFCRAYKTRFGKTPTAERRQAPA